MIKRKHFFFNKVILEQMIKEKALLLRSTYLIVSEAELLELCQPVQPAFVHRYHLKKCCLIL